MEVHHLIEEDIVQDKTYSAAFFSAEGIQFCFSVFDNFLCSLDPIAESLREDNFAPNSLLSWTIVTSIARRNNGILVIFLFFLLIILVAYVLVIL